VSATFFRHKKNNYNVLSNFSNKLDYILERFSMAGLWNIAIDARNGELRPSRQTIRTASPLTITFVAGE